MKSVGRVMGVFLAGTIACTAPAALSRQAGDTAMGTVLFAPDSDKITPEGAKVLDGVAARFKDPSKTIIVRGHSEPTEHAKFGPEYGVGLSHRRASNVVSYLVGRGVKAGNVTAQAFGDTRPIKGARPAKLRRVEVAFSAGSGW